MPRQRKITTLFNPEGVKSAINSPSDSSSPTNKLCVLCNNQIEGRLKRYCRLCLDTRKIQKETPTTEDDLKCKNCKIYKPPINYTVVYKTCADCRDKKNNNKTKKETKEGVEEVEEMEEQQKTKQKINIEKLQKIILYLQKKYNIMEDVEELLKI